MELHNTRMGRKLIEGDLPRAIDALERIASALEKLNKPLKPETNGMDERSMETNP